MAFLQIKVKYIFMVQLSTLFFLTMPLKAFTFLSLIQKQDETAGGAMGFQCGLVGLPNSGKSTIFNALTNLSVEVSAYPFCTIDPHVGSIPLEDHRLDTIHQLIGSKKKTPTVLEFVDIAGLIKNASHGEGLGNQFLSHIGRVDAIAHIVRCFENPNVSHPYETLDPVRDAEIVSIELILKDLEIVERQLSKSQTAARTGDPKSIKVVEALSPLRDHLAGEKEIRTLTLSEFQQDLVREFNLLTAKPLIFIANVDENHISQSTLFDALSAHASSVHAPCIPFCGQIQAEIAKLPQKDQLEFVQAMGLDETGLQKIVNTGYAALNLITFFTANENEAHAWTLVRGTLVHKAAGRIHTDFEKGFIKAEIIKIDDLIANGSHKALHDHGLIAIHGRDYVVVDGDLILFRIQKGK
jgi:GTP-binding protein YchF